MLLLWSCLVGSSEAFASNQPLTSEIIARSQLSAGDLARLSKVLRTDPARAEFCRLVDEAFANKDKAQAELQAWLYGSWDIVAGGMTSCCR